jgi:hypothetical protein
MGGEMNSRKKVFEADITFEQAKEIIMREGAIEDDDNLILDLNRDDLYELWIYRLKK